MNNLNQPLKGCSLALWSAHKAEHRGNDIHDKYAVINTRRDVRHRIMQNYMDYKKRGKGSKAWKRADSFNAGCLDMGLYLIK